MVARGIFVCVGLFSSANAIGSLCLEVPWESDTIPTKNGRELGEI